MKMDFGVALGSNLRIDEIADHARVAEESGFSHLAFVDQPEVSRDMYVMMTIAALNTHRIRIGQGVTNPFTYHPVVTANATATLSELTGGRVFVGIGAGGTALRAMMYPKGKGKARPMEEFRAGVEFVRKYIAGQEGEWNGARIHSGWTSQQVPIYMACTGARSCELAGEIADGVIIIGVNPELVKWKMELIEKGALKAGRDPSKIDVWDLTMIYVAESKETARREVASFAATCARDAYAPFEWENPPMTDLRRRLERAEQGIIEEFKLVHDNYDEYRHEMTDCPQAELITQRVTDFFLLTGTAEDICEQIYKLGQLGVKTIQTAVYSLIDQKGMMREIGDKIMPHFRN